MIRNHFRALPLLGLLALPSGARADRLEDLTGLSIERHAQGALAVLGISAVPSETASALEFNTGTRPGGQSDFQAAQLGAGITLSEAFPLYLEGYIGYDRYDPHFTVTDGTQSARLRPKWTGFAATGGIGWDFRLTDALVLRPMANVALGQVVSDTSFVAQFIANRIGAEDAAFLRDGGLTAGGLGGSLVLAYDRSWENDLQAEYTLRYTYLHLEPIGGDRDIVASAEASTLALWSRLRMPTGIEAFGGPLRTVAEFSASWLPGDQGEILNTDWLAQTGYGIEFDVSRTGLPLVTKGRLVFRYSFGEHLTGYGLGLAASF
ncbi:autotransporter domain-containing protein [Amaricoccus solimangrovi]|nr:autotransporter domain-containing protein [Amaricoccus solimangrovi]